jgi:hypothetical protein
MAFTRFHDDIGRIKKRLDISSFSGKYAITTPGPGDNLPYIQDPQFRLQSWGANLRTNTIHLESDLLGLTRKLNRDLIDYNNYKNQAVNNEAVSYPENTETLVDESRATHPAWMYRDAIQPRWETPFLDPQANVELRFPNNIQTRILEKDSFERKWR